MVPENFVSHSRSTNSFIKSKPISKKNNLIGIPPIVDSYSSSSPYLSVHFNFNIHTKVWDIQSNNRTVLIHSTFEDSTGSSQVILNLSDIMLYKRLDHAISNMLTHEFEDQRGSILDRTTRQLTRLMTITKSNYKCRRKVLGACVNVTLVINHFCDRALHASEELFNGMVPASKSSIKNECIVCLSEINKESEALCMPCSHIFHGECIIRWLEKSHYCPLCRFAMPTE